MRIIKIPANAGALSKKKGIEAAPDAVAGMLNEYFLKENSRLPVLETEDLPVDNASVEATNRVIFEKAMGLDTPAIIIGGDHSITYPLFRGFSAKSANPGIIVFDAHADCENSFSPPTHEDYLRVLIEEEVVKPQNVILIGCRNIHSNEHEFLKMHKVKVYDMRELFAEGVKETCDAIMSAALGFDSLYVSVDIDVLDPAFAPGTGYREPGGLTTRELLYMLQRIRLLKNWRMMDVVEVNPSKDVNNITVAAAAKIVVEMC